MSMEQVTTYRVKGKESTLILLFKYDLNGNLKAFEIQEGELDVKQMIWLFAGTNFPADESMIRTNWMKDEKYTKVFSVEKSPAVLTFDALWILYDHKVAKVESMKAFKKLKEGDVIHCFIAVPHYLNYLKKNPGIGKLHLATYINKRRFDDEIKQTEGKNYNKALQELAAKKVSK